PTKMDFPLIFFLNSLISLLEILYNRIVLKLELIWNLLLLLLLLLLLYITETYYQTLKTTFNTIASFCNFELL
ncbi:hypothetical protein ACMBCM_06725, partial [Spiroplasma sp. K1]